MTTIGYIGLSLIIFSFVGVCFAFASKFFEIGKDIQKIREILEKKE